MERIQFLGCPVDSLDMNEALEWIEGRIRNRIPSQISVINANKLWQMRRDSRLANFIKNSALVIPEWAVYWGAKQLGTPLKAPVYGVVLLQAVLPWAEKKGFGIYFLGAKPEVIRALENQLRCTYPALKIAGLHHGYFRSYTENEAVCDAIIRSQADILFVAMGSPRQEYWIQENLSRVQVPVAMGVGGSFDVIAGLKPDTPAWARGHGIEWLYRLMQEPKAYWKRYMIVNPWFVWQVFKEKFTFQRKSKEFV